MKNDFVFACKRDFNPFTRALKARCQAEGEVLVRLRNGTCCHVRYSPENEAAYESESFHLADGSACWELSGHSVTAERFDIAECAGLEPSSIDDAAP